MSFWDYVVWFFWVYVAISCIWIFITVIIDVFRDPGLNGWAKALWVLFLVFLPFIAVFIYLIARGRSISQRRAAEFRGAQAETNDYIRAAAGSGSAASEIEKGKALLDSGAISAAEYDALKSRVLAAA